MLLIALFFMPPEREAEDLFHDAALAGWVIGKDAAESGGAWRISNRGRLG